jgi:endonuclease YncB( thermonuclease family)
VLFCGGCATPGPAANPPPSYFVSRDGAIRYRLPAGWFDVTPDTLSADRAVFLVRDDYAGSLTVRQVHIRAVDKADLGGEGLLEVAKLTAALETSSKPGMLAREPDRYPINGREAVSYDVEYNGSGDRTRTVLLAVDGRLYALTALVNGTAPPGAVKEIFGVLQTFIASLRL